MGPPERGGDWTDEGVEGVHRFLARLWRLGRRGRRRPPRAPSADADAAEGDALALRRKAHWAIDKATRDFERGFQFNTVIAAVMELVNEAYRLKDGLPDEPAGVAALSFAAAHRGLADPALRSPSRLRGLRAPQRRRAPHRAALAAGRPGSC